MNPALPGIALKKRCEEAQRKCAVLEERCTQLQGENTRLKQQIKALESRLDAACARAATAAEEVKTLTEDKKKEECGNDGIIYLSPLLIIGNDNRDFILNKFPVFERLDTLLDIFDPLADNETVRAIWNSLRSAHRDIRNHAFCGELFPIEQTVIDSYVQSIKGECPFKPPCIPSLSTTVFWVPKQTVLLIYGQSETEEKKVE